MSAKEFNCPFCNNIFLTPNDLVRHLKAFSDKGEAHKDAVRRLHLFIEEVGTERLNEDFSQVEFQSPEQILASFVWVIRDFYGLSQSVRMQFARKKKKVRSR